MRRTFVVGDVHGCLDELEALLRVAGLSDDDRLVFVGDLLAKGPESQGVVQLARERGALSVLGNHDAHVLGARANQALKPHHASIARQLTAADWAWLELLPCTLDLPELNTLVVHGGLVPGLALSRQPRELLLNLRSFDSEGNPSPRVEGGVPWASRWPGPRHVLFGHDAVRGLQHHPNATGLDTGCVYGRQLTGLWLPERRLVSVPAKRVWCQPEGRPADE